MTQDLYLVTFLYSFAIGLLWFRVIMVLFPEYLKRPILRTKLDVRWHHLHYGIILSQLGFIFTIIDAHDLTGYIVTGLGLGLTTDEFFLFLHEAPATREEELRLYDKTLWPTLFLFASIAAAALLLFYLLV